VNCLSSLLGESWQQAIESNGPGCISDSGVFEHATTHRQSDTALYFIDATHFEMVVLDELRSVNNVSVGNPIVVTLSNPGFQVKADGLPVPSALQGNFEGAMDTSQLLPGQTVQIRLMGPANPGPPVAVTTNRVRLRMTQFTANVKADSIVSPNFTVDTLPALFTNAGIGSIHVQTSSKTDFEGVSSVSALVDGHAVSLRGLLFNNGALPPELIAKKVRKR
jgi:hypothetical protein